MAQCPICKRYDIFGEQVCYLNVISDNFYFDCPSCGAFRMNTRTRTIAYNMRESDAKALMVWVLEQNLSGAVPLVKESLVTKMTSGKREKILQETF